MAITTLERSQITQLAVSMFAAAPGGYLTELTDMYIANGKDLAALSNELAQLDAYKVNFPVYQTNEEIATQMCAQYGLTNLSSGIGQQAYDYFLGELTVGVTVGELYVEANNFLSTTTDTAWATPQALFLNQAAVAEYYTVEMGGSTKDLNALKSVISAVTATTDTTTDAAIEAFVDATLAGMTIPGLTLGLGQDLLSGTSGADMFKAFIIGNADSLQSGDIINGGNGTDTLSAELGNASAFAITAKTQSIENVTIRSQANNIQDGTDNNVGGGANIVDAQDMVGVTKWTNTDSRADLKIEDIRILEGQVTKDITIALVNTDPSAVGNANANSGVDFEVYFSPESLRKGNGTSTTSIDLMVGSQLATASGFNPAQPLKDIPYTQVSFLVDGQEVTILLALNGVTTYPEMLAAFTAGFEAAKAINPLLANVTLTSDAPENAFVSTAGEARLQDVYTLTITNGTIAPIGGSAWTASGGLPSNNAFSGDVFIGGQSATGDLITSTIILDNVGREDESGSLVIGGMGTRTGVEKFDITVENNVNTSGAHSTSGSWVSDMRSTNNTLQEVYARNATANVATPDYLYIGTGMTATNDMASLRPYTEDLLNTDGLSDVRIFDASAMAGEVKVGANITAASIQKYMDLRDMQANPSDDQINFVYTAGTNNDSMNIAIDGSVAASNSNIVAGREDFTITANGGAGDDHIQMTLTDLVGGAQNWAVNQELNANVFVNGGEGNDTIAVVGAGNFIVKGEAGNDTVYVDQMGAQAGLTGTTATTGTWVVNTFAQAGASIVISDLRSDANDTLHDLYKANMTVTFKGLTATAVVPSTNYVATDLQINQAIKEAINTDATLSKLLVATDGPANTLVITSLIDGAMVAGDLAFALSAGTLTAPEAAAVAAAHAGYDGFTIPATFAADYSSTLATDDAGATDITGADSAFVNDSTITGGTGNDVIVLSTTAGASEDLSSNNTVVYDAAFGNDVIVNFDASGTIATGDDILDFSALTSANGVVTIAAVGAAVDNGLAAANAAEDATASTDIYISYNTANVGYVYSVLDGTGADDAVATLLGTIDLADTGWATLAAINVIA